MDTVLICRSFQKIAASAATKSGSMLLSCWAGAILLTVIPGLRAQTGKFEVFYEFGAGPVGEVPMGALIQGTNGNFYGTTEIAGKNNTGTVYEVTPSGTATVLHTFPVAGTNDIDDGGIQPVTALVEDSSGNFYGTAPLGGTTGRGTIFKLTTTGVFTVLHNFTAQDNTGDNADGAYPEATLLLGRDGNFYGTTDQGGAKSSGTAFKMTPTGAFTTLSSDAGYAQLVEGSDGNFYGTQGGGGTAGDGRVYKLTPAGVVTTLHSFADTGGRVPSRILTLGSDGNFYGTTIFGGTGNSGTIFEMTPPGAVTTLHNFTARNANTLENADGANPYGGVIEGKDGNFYGAANAGGTKGFGNGTVYKITPAGAFTTLYSFSAEDDRGVNNDGAEPMVPLLKASDGNLYGAASRGGPVETGTLFKITFTPGITSAGTASATVGKSFSYQITATNSPTSYGVQGLPAGLSVNGSTGLISGTPKTSGTYTLTLNVYNGYGKSSSTLTLTVKPVAAPVITSAATATATQGTAFSYQVTATNSPTSYGVQGLPTGLTINASTGLISGTPKGAGKLTLTLNASNSIGKGSATLTLTIMAAPPVITSAASASATVGKAFSYQITATNQPTTFGVQGLPAGLIVNSTTGLISGTPKAAGKATLTLNAYNSVGKGSATVTLTISSS